MTQHLIAVPLLAVLLLSACGPRAADTVPARPGADAPVLETGWPGDAAPDFRPLPLMEWGPAPAGTPHAERERTYDLRHQVVRVRFDWPRHAVIGSTTLTVAPLEGRSLRDVALDAVGMDVKSVTDEGGSALPYEYDDTTLVVHLPAPIRAGGEARVRVEYEAVRPAQGVYFIDRVGMLWTQGETEATRYWVPTYDYPNDRTTWEIVVTTPPDEKALSNGRLVATRDVPGGTEWHWSLEHPASTYLMSVVAGDYAVVEDRWRDVPVNYWTYPDSIPAARRGFGRTPEAMEIFARKTGVDYMWSKYDQSVAPDFIFGGMENVTATTQLDDGILHPAWAEPEANADGLMAHELGHQWYGDALTTETWPHIWLNEGFATFMAQTFQEVAKGQDEGAWGRAEAQRDVVEADSAGRRPLVYDRWVTDPFELFFSGHIYPKGATVLQMLRHELGDSTFWAAMNRYTTENLYQNVVTEDLVRAFETTTGRDLDRFFDQWVYGAGFPVFRVHAAWDEDARALHLRARQVQPRDSMTGFFDADVDVKVMTDAGVVREVMPVSGEWTTARIPLPAPPRAIVWDEGGWLLDITDFPRSTDMLVYQLRNDDDVLGRADAIADLSRRPDDAAAVEAIAAAAREDSFWGVRQVAAEALAALPGARAALVEATRDADSRVRSAAALSLTAHPGTDVAARLLEMSRSDPSFYVRGDALNAYAQIVPADRALAAARVLLGQDSWTDLLRTRAINALEHVRDPAAWDTIRRYLDRPTARDTRLAAIEAVAAHADGRERQAAALLEPLLDADDVYVRQTAAEALGEIALPSSLAALQRRAAIEAESRVKNSILAAIEILSR